MARLKTAALRKKATATKKDVMDLCDEVDRLRTILAMIAAALLERQIGEALRLAQEKR